MYGRTGLIFVALLLSSAFPGYAQLSPPQLYEKGMNSLMGAGGATHSEHDALEYFRRSADLGYAPAQVAMGYFYETGTLLGAEPGRAADWYKKAAQQDDRLGDWLLGRLYYQGSGVARNLDLAATNLQRAANQNDPFAQYLLGMIHLERSQFSEAAEYLRKASLQGLLQAQEQLGLLLKDGRQNVPRDRKEAYIWFLVSADGGNQAVQNHIADLEGALANDQVEAAKTQARELEKTVTRSLVARGCTGWPGEFGAVPSPPPLDVHRFCR
ncbi:MAG: sel1 repeat family protein [Acidobacteria bacterium]|nr:sel1 repeat family protein [Acidobacteriota bacterium]